jgi:DNA helicase-2/ATP-dependent DNA helicase PcrA
MPRRSSSDPGLLTQFFEKDAATFQLSRNHRSVPEIIEVANIVASGFDDALLATPMVASRADTGAVARATLPDERAQAEMIRDQIAALRFKGFQYSDIAILLRSVSTSGGPIMDILEESGIPFTVAGSAGLFRSTEACVLGMLFCWFGDRPWRDSKYSGLEGPEGLELKALGLWAKLLPRSGARVGDILDIKLRLAGGGYTNITEVFQATLVALHVELLDRNIETHAIILENLGRFNTLLTDLEAPFRYDGVRPTWAALLRNISNFINQYATGSYEGAEASEERRGLGVNIMTIHQSKGLEWPIVIVPALSERRFPSTDQGAFRPLDVSIDVKSFNSQKYIANEESMRKLFYVATTRAMDGLIFTSHARTAQQVQKPTGFLDWLNKIEEPQYPLLRAPIRSKALGERFSVVSTSDIISYGQCPNCFWLRSIGFQPGLKEGIGFGRSIHAALHAAADSLKSKGTSSDAEIASIVEATFHTPYSTERQRSDQKKKALKMVTEHIHSQREALRTIREAEAHVETEVGDRIYISGRIDLVLASDNSVEIRDYKTMNMGPGEKPSVLNDSRFQLQVYAGAMRHSGEDVRAASIALLADNKIEPVDVAASAVKQAISRARQYAKGIVERNFAPSDANPGCGACDFELFCAHCHASKIKDDSGASAK